MGRLANIPMPFWNWYTYKNHTGLDWAQPCGTPIRAIEDGVITYADWWGNKAAWTRTLTIPKYGGLKFMMSHLDDVNRGPAVGTHVKQGEIVAYVGNTGLSTGCHLHGEMYLNGVAQIEQDWFDLNNWIGKNGNTAGGGGSAPITPGTLLEDEMILIAQRKDANKAKGRYNPENGRIREITKSENELLRAGQAAGAGANIVYGTISDAAYTKLLTGAK